MADDKVLKTVVGTLSRLFNPAIVRDAVKAAAAEAGLMDIDAYLPAAPAPKDAAATPGKKGKKEKAERKPGRMQPYTVFVTKVMDRINHEASYSSLSTGGPDGEKVHPMSIAAGLWKGLGDASREAFSRAYQVRRLRFATSLNLRTGRRHAVSCMGRESLIRYLCLSM